jgi:hypothetical protein
MSVRADSGGSSGPGFDPGSKYYDPGVVDTQCVAFRGSADGESVWGALWSGGGGTRGAVESAMKAANPAGLTQKAALWDSAFDDVAGYTNALDSIYSKISSAWSGDDADQALQTLGGLHATLADQIEHTGTMTSTLKDMAADLTDCKNAWGHDSSVMGGLGNWVTGDQDRAAAADYNRLVSNCGTYLDRMPHSVPTQVKTSGGAAFSTGPDMPGNAGAGGAPSVGGPSGAAHAGDPAAAAIRQPGLADPHVGGPGSDEPSYPGMHPTSSNLGDPPYGSGVPGGGSPIGGVSTANGVPTGGIPAGPGGVGTGPGSTALPGGSDVGSVGSGASTLAGYDPVGGAAGTGVGVAGDPALIPDGAVGAAGGVGPGAAGLGGGLLAGAAGGRGDAERTRDTTVPAGRGGTAGGAASASGGRGLFPMRGGAAGDDDEHERSTWLVEDDEVWGGEDGAPSVIVR